MNAEYIFIKTVYKTVQNLENGFIGYQKFYKEIKCAIKNFERNKREMG